MDTIIHHRNWGAEKSYDADIDQQCNIMPSSSHGKRCYETHLETYHTKTGTYRHTVRIFKIDATIRNAFPKCICGTTPPQTRRLLPKIGRLLPRIGKFFPKNRKASSEEHWVHTHISFRDAVQLCLRIFRVCVCLRIPAQRQKGFRIAASILKTHTVLIMGDTNTYRRLTEEQVGIPYRRPRIRNTGPR